MFKIIIKYDLDVVLFEYSESEISNRGYSNQKQMRGKAKKIANYFLNVISENMKSPGHVKKREEVFIFLILL